MSRRLFRTSLTTAKAAVGLAALLLSVSAQAAPPADTKSDDTVDTEDKIKGETAIFARFSDLGSEETVERLEALLAKKETAELVYAMTKALTSDDVVSKDIESAMLTLIKGMKTEESDATLAAIMLDYYEQHVAGRLEVGKIGISDAFDELDDRADVVLTAAYGSYKTLPKSSKTAHRIYAKRRRI